MDAWISWMSLLELAISRAEATPTPLGALVREEEVTRHRNLSCSEYDRCLDEALLQAWRSWSCMRCRRFESDRGARAGELAHHAVERI